MKNDSLANVLTAYIDKRMSKINTDASRSKSLYKYGSYELKIGATSDEGMALTWKESGTAKLSIGMIPDKAGTLIPCLVLGAGSGNGDNRGYITKSTSGISMFYVGTLSSSEIMELYLTNTSFSLLYNGSEVYKVIRTSGYTDVEAYDTVFQRFYATQVNLYQTWDFTYATVAGLWATNVADHHHTVYVDATPGTFTTSSNGNHGHVVE